MTFHVTCPACGAQVDFSESDLLECKMRCDSCGEEAVFLSAAREVQKKQKWYALIGIGFYIAVSVLFVWLIKLLFQYQDEYNARVMMFTLIPPLIIVITYLKRIKIKMFERKLKKYQK